MVQETPLNPLLIFPHSKTASAIGQSVDHSISSVKFASGEASKGSPFIAEPFELSQAQWVWLATQRWPLFEAWMKNPADPSVRLKLAREALGPEMRAFSDEGFSGGEPVSDEYVDLTGVSPKGLNDFFARAGGAGPAFIRVIIGPDGSHRIEWRKAPFIKEKEVRRAFSSEIERGSPVYRLSNHTALGKVVTSVSDKVIEGGLALVIPDYAIFDSPSRIALSAKGAGELHYFRVGESAAPKGSSVEFIMTPSEGLSVSERFRVGDLLGLLERDAVAAWKRGKLPSLALDLDGTFFDARGYTVLLFREWLSKYDGPDAKAVRDLVAKAGDVTGWNGREILKGLGVTRPETLQSAYEYHERYFFDPVRRASSLPIKGTIKLVKLLQHRLAQRGVPLKLVFLTLRNAKDDSLTNGRSSSEISLLKNGIFFHDQKASHPVTGKVVDASSKIERHDGVIDWSEEAYKNPKHEPEKWEMAARFQKENPDVWFVGVFDNATAHINGYENIFGHNIVSVHIKGDLPPNSPSLIDGVFTIDPWQLEREIAEIGDVPQPDLSRPPAALAGPAFAPMLEAIKAAWKSGKRPVVAVDIDDTIFESSERMKRVMSGIFSSWYPENTWVKEFVSKFTPFNVEYGAHYLTQQAGLSHLGLHDQFQDEFMKGFLGKEEAHKVGVRKNALNWLLALESLGVRIIYLGGRHDHSEVRKATAWQLKSLGFPVDDMGVELVMRKNQGETNDVFKVEAMEGLVGPFDYVVGVFDKDTKVLSELSRMYGRAPLYKVGDSAAPDAPEAPEGTIPISDFSGKIGAFSQKRSVKLGEEMRLEGSQLATEFVKIMLAAWVVEQQFSKAESRSIIAPRLSEAAAILKRVASLDPAHPLHASFVNTLNREYEEIPERLARPPEDFIDMLNRGSKEPFVLLRGFNEIWMVAQAKKGVLKINKSYAPQAALQSNPPPVIVLGDPGGVNLFSALSVMGQGPDFASLTTEEKARALLGLERFFPRADFALSHVVGSLMERTGKGLSGLHVVEHSPGISLYTLATLANMGINVEWLENDEARRLQTEYAIGRLPEELQSRIRHVDTTKKRKPADLIILTGNDVGSKLRYIVGKEFDDTVMVQSEVTAAQFEEELKGKSKFSCKGSLQCGRKGFVLPVFPHSKSAMNPTFMILQQKAK